MSNRQNYYTSKIEISYEGNISVQEVQGNTKRRLLNFVLGRKKKQIFLFTFTNPHKQYRGSTNFAIYKYFNFNRTNNISSRFASKGVKQSGNSQVASHGFMFLFQVQTKVICTLAIRYIYFLVSIVSCTSQNTHGEPGNLVLRHSVLNNILPFPTFHRILEPLSVEQRILTPHFVLLPQRRNEDIKYFICSSENQTHNMSRQRRGTAILSEKPFLYKIIIEVDDAGLMTPQYMV